MRSSLARVAVSEALSYNIGLEYLKTIDPENFPFLKHVVESRSREVTADVFYYRGVEPAKRWVKFLGVEGVEQVYRTYKEDPERAAREISRFS